MAVFGASGHTGHDPPGMGRAAARATDLFIITTDDPVTRDPAGLARQIESGVEGRRPGDATTK